MATQFLNSRIYRLKLLLVAVGLLILGVALAVLRDWLAASDAPRLAGIVMGGLSDVVLVAGAIGIAVDFFTGRDKDAADTERTRSVLKELTPDFTDAVVKGFAVSPDDLKRVATPALLDDIATNALALRLGDDQFAREIYTDVRDQAIRAAERWYDVDVSVRLSSMDERETNGLPRFQVLVTWEYTVTPSKSLHRFACVSDRDEFHELVSDVPSTATWFMTPRPGFDARERESYELLAFSVDGQDRQIRRSTKKSGQIYSVSIGDDLVAAGKPVRIRHVYRTVTPKSGHRLFVEIAQPTRGLSLEMEYSDTDIAHMSVTDLVTSSHRTQIVRMPEQVGAKVISADLPAWLLPKAGFTFVWTLASELPPDAAPASSHSGRRSAAA